MAHTCANRQDKMCVQFEKSLDLFYFLISFTTEWHKNMCIVFIISKKKKKKTMGTFCLGADRCGCGRV